MRLSRILLAPTAAGLLMLAACTPAPTPSDPASAGEGTGAGEEPGGGSSAGAGCLEGDWEADIDVMEANAVNAPGLAAFGGVATVSGTSFTTFDGSMTTSVYDNQSTEVTWSLNGQEYRTVATYDGTLRGAYTVTDTELTMTDVDITELTVESTSFVDGAPLALPGVSESVRTALEAGGTSAYTCSGDELRLEPIVADVDTSNFVTVLHRR